MSGFNFAELARITHTDIWSICSRLRMCGKFISDSNDDDAITKFNGIMKKLAEIDDEMFELRSVIDTNILGIKDREAEFQKDCENLIEEKQSPKEEPIDENLVKTIKKLTNEDCENLVIDIRNVETYKHLYEFLVKYNIGKVIDCYNTYGYCGKSVEINMTDVINTENIIKKYSEGTWGGRCYVTSSEGKRVFEDMFIKLWSNRIKHLR